MLYLPVFAGSRHANQPAICQSRECLECSDAGLPGGVAWRGVGQGDGALEVKTRFSNCSLSYVWPSQEKLTVGLWGIFHLFGVCYGQTVARVKLG